MGHSCDSPFGLQSYSLLVTTSFSGPDRMDNLLKDHRCPILSASCAERVGDHKCKSAGCRLKHKPMRETECGFAKSTSGTENRPLRIILNRRCMTASISLSAA